MLRRDRILPISELNALLGIPKLARIAASGEQLLLVALVVDGFRETLDFIQKSLAGALAKPVAGPALIGVIKQVLPGS